MSDNEPFFGAMNWIESQSARMAGLVIDWAGINSGSRNLEGLARLAKRLADDFGPLGGELTSVVLPDQQIIDSRGQIVSAKLGSALLIRKRSAAPLRVFLGIHMDTVYSPDDPFHTVRDVGDGALEGPGVADAKGGLAVMLIALEALERSGHSENLGWDVLINPDEEIGSPGSADLLAQCAARNDLGLVFEPALPDGSLVSRRKGSGVFSVVVRGTSAHAGRDFAAGRNAVVAAAEIATRTAALSGSVTGLTVNVGRIDGGGAVNVVPELAIVRLNVRVAEGADQFMVETALEQIAAETAAVRGVEARVHGGFHSPPKTLDERTRQLCRSIEECGRAIDVKVRWQPSGGACDGNKLAAAGMAVIDTMGPRGGNLHSPREYLLLESLAERAKLTAMLLLRLAAGQIAWPVRRGVR